MAKMGHPNDAPIDISNNRGSSSLEDEYDEEDDEALDIVH